MQTSAKFDFEQDYLNLCRRVIDEGEWVVNARTGKRCKTVINADLQYDLRTGYFPVLTTKKLYWKSAIAEMLGYWRGYDNAAQFRALGTKTWDANSNENAAWLANPFRKPGEGDLGRAYGVQGRQWKNPEGKPIDQLAKVVANLSRGIDDRREIITFYNVGELDRMCLAPCMHTHTFSLLGDTLYLTSYQRSDDLPLGHGFNAVQVAWLLAVMAQICNLKPGIAYHKIVNAHVYEDQIGILSEIQLQRDPLTPPKLVINPEIRSLSDLDTWVTVDDFKLEGYISHPAIQYPFSV